MRIGNTEIRIVGLSLWDFHWSSEWEQVTYTGDFEGNGPGTSAPFKSYAFGPVWVTRYK